jgi:hypothetical protein
MWCLLDTTSINLRARYIRSAANVRADKLNRHLDSDEWKLDPVLLAELDARFGRHSIDRFASALNTLLSRYSAGWRDPACKALDALHPLDDKRCKEKNRCNPPWPLLPNLVQKLRQSTTSFFTTGILDRGISKVLVK